MMRCSLLLTVPLYGGLSLLIATASLLPAETRALTIPMILHAIGEEHYDIALSRAGLTLNTTFEYTDRGNKRTPTAELRMKADYTPVLLEIKAARPETVDVRDNLSLPARYFTI